MTASTVGYDLVLASSALQYEEGWQELLEGARAAGLELEREFILQPPLPIDAAPDQASYAAFLFRPG